MTGKDKCKMLREIRRRIAEENDIELITSECTHKGACRGTCPKCEAELRFLERSLARRKSLGKRVTVAALALGMTASMAGCVLPEITLKPGGELEGDVPMQTAEPEPTDEPVILDGEVAYVPDDDPEIYELEGDVAYVPDDREELEGEPAVGEFESVLPTREPDARIPETPTPVVPETAPGAQG
ncbi:MAG: hypothetical protein J6P71_07320 [Oscillospiraceae bacterium]|nr:hypothetical protein [Oscillospiraceae bacterium]